MRKSGENEPWAKRRRKGKRKEMQDWTSGLPPHSHPNCRSPQTLTFILRNAGNTGRKLLSHPHRLPDIWDIYPSPSFPIKSKPLWITWTPFWLSDSDHILGLKTTQATFGFFRILGDNDSIALAWYDSDFSKSPEYPGHTAVWNTWTLEDEILGQKHSKATMESQG